MATILVDAKEINTEEGKNLLQVCLDQGIYIPNLCHLECFENPSASCRLCFVEIEGEKDPVTACTTAARDGMVVKTDTPSVRRLQRSALRLLLSVHRVECGRCPANRHCGLQDIARFLKVGLNPRPFVRYLKEPEIVQDHPFLDYYPNRCVLCERCIRVCRRMHGQPVLTFARRGFDTIISFFGETDEPTLPCGECLACVEVCPVAALRSKDRRKRVILSR